MVARLFFFFYLFLCSCCQTRASQTRAGESAHCATLRRERGARVARRAARPRRELGQQASPLAPDLLQASGLYIARAIYLEYRLKDSHVLAVRWASTRQRPMRRRAAPGGPVQLGQARTCTRVAQRTGGVALHRSLPNIPVSYFFHSLLFFFHTFV